MSRLEAEVEDHVDAAERCRPGVGGGLRRCGDPHHGRLLELRVDGLEEIFLAREVVVEAPPRAPPAAHDVLDRRRCVPARGEEVGSRVEKGATRGLGVLLTPALDVHGRLSSYLILTVCERRSVWEAGTHEH